MNCFNVSMDGAVFSKQKAIGVGVIIWDDKGRLKAAMTMKLHAPLGALEVEAKAFEVGMQFAKDVGIQDVVLEGDSIIINRALCELSTPPSSMAPIIEGILDLSKDFRRVQFSHIRRQGNNVGLMGEPNRQPPKAPNEKKPLNFYQ